ncbi:MAG: hypothetical protein WCD18_05025 [Thermosynechococcaceae cyanobacterium]
MLISDRLKRLRYSTRNFFGSNQYCYPLVSLNPKLKDWMVYPNTDICIEGFPRSGNSFVHQAFQLFNPKAKVAHHIHVPMQVMKAIQYSIPAVVIIRNPLHATGSSLLSHPHLDSDLILKNYINFYKKLMPFRSQFFSVSFEDATQNFPNLVMSVNQIYRTEFLCDAMTDSNIKKIFMKIEEQHETNHQPQHMIALPTKEKEELKDGIYKKIKQSYFISNAEEIYKEFLKN